MTNDDLDKLFKLAYTQVYSGWREMQDIMLLAHEEIKCLQSRIKELENKTNASS
jgi:hypothetical protein